MISNNDGAFQKICSEQKAKRDECLNKIICSKAPKKLIISGPGTGKTYIFKQILQQNASGKNLVMTFIRKLVDDMAKDLGTMAEVKTFHAYCKKILHEKCGGFELFPNLTKVIEDDARLLEKNYKDFDSKFQILEESSEEIKFYIERGEYYNVVSFNDSVYKLYKLLLNDPSIIGDYDYILIDEFQDFNPLEVAFIKEIAKRGSILIVGDDDQAVYTGRHSSPIHLCEICNSGEYVFFELPYCCRCPKVIVEAVNAFIISVQKIGGMKGRIDRRFEPYLEAKEYENNNYPRIIKAQVNNLKTLSKYVLSEIQKIPIQDISDSKKVGDEYPTVLVIGQKHYLNEIQKKLEPIYPHLVYTYTKDFEIDAITVYNFFINNIDSNFSWRLLLFIYYSADIEYQKKIINASLTGLPLVQLLDPEFVKAHKYAADLLKLLKSGKKLSVNSEKDLKKILGIHFKTLYEYYSIQEEEVAIAVDQSQPMILLTSFEGCKGLSGGHIFIVGANNGSLPRIVNGKIEDIECCRFIVALTRTRKCCHIVTNKWLYSPKDKEGKWMDPYEESCFLQFIPSNLLEDRGLIKGADLK